MDIVFGSGPVIARQAHARLGHDGDFEACRLCHRFIWSPDTDLGALVTGPGGRVVDRSGLAARLLTP